MNQESSAQNQGGLNFTTAALRHTVYVETPNKIGSMRKQYLRIKNIVFQHRTVVAYEKCAVQLLLLHARYNICEYSVMKKPFSFIRN